MHEECAKLFYIPTLLNKLDKNCNLIGFNNGIYDIRTNELRKHKMEDFVSWSTHTDFIDNQFMPDTDSNTEPVICSFIQDKAKRELFIHDLRNCLFGKSSGIEYNIVISPVHEKRLIRCFRSLGDYTKRVAYITNNPLWSNPLWSNPPISASTNMIIRNESKPGKNTLKIEFTDDSYHESDAKFINGLLLYF